MQTDGRGLRRTITFSAGDIDGAHCGRQAFQQLCAEHGITWRFIRGSILLGTCTVLSCEYEFPAGSDLSPLRHLLNESGGHP